MRKLEQIRRKVNVTQTAYALMALSLADTVQTDLYNPVKVKVNRLNK